MLLQNNIFVCQLSWKQMQALKYLHIIYICNIMVGQTTNRHCYKLQFYSFK